MLPDVHELPNRDRRLTSLACLVTDLDVGATLAAAAGQSGEVLDLVGEDEDGEAVPDPSAECKRGPYRRRGKKPINA